MVHQAMYLQNKAAQYIKRLLQGTFSGPTIQNVVGTIDLGFVTIKLDYGSVGLQCETYQLQEGDMEEDIYFDGSNTIILQRHQS